ncbi:MAG: hypothetical protein L0I76_05200 [Pseudonocardia sp.]|nr:hypothetical protein [Pseudonocardia sp.]
MTADHVGAGANVVPGRYRGVAVARVGCALDETSLREHFLGREAYRKTRFVVVRPAGPDPDGPVAIVAVRRAGDDALFAPITAVDLLAGPDECVLLQRPDCDTAIPSDLARVAETDAPGVRAVVVQGRYEHVNFILEPRALRVTVREVVPPRPAKLIDQASRIIAVTESLPPIRLELEVVDLADLARAHPAGHYLLPCRGGGAEIPGARLSYLDERPEHADWTLLGCERSRQIHRWFYGRDAPGPDMCPRTAPASGPLLTKCCLQQEDLCSGTTADGAPWVSVPWGSSLDVVRDGLGVLAQQQEPSWSPA